MAVIICEKCGAMLDYIEGDTSVVCSFCGTKQALPRFTNELQATENDMKTMKQRSNSVEPLLRRAFLLLEDGELDKAINCCDRVLDQDPENAQAYLGKLMADMKVRKQEDLLNCERSDFFQNNNYQKAVRFGDESLVETLNSYSVRIHQNVRYSEANATMIEAGNSYCQDSMFAPIKWNHSIAKKKFEEAADLFKSISGFKDSDTRAEACLKAAEQHRQLQQQEKRNEEEKKIEKEKQNTIGLWVYIIGLILVVLFIIWVCDGVIGFLKLMFK